MQKTILLLLFSLASCASDFELKSSKKQTQVIELFTSEGCSSCPPADKWLSSLINDKGLWKIFIPMAFHVDYWDYIGWKDNFANPKNSQRQKQHYKKGNIPTVYTPGILKAGKEWRMWRFNTTIQPSEKSVGVLTVSLTNHLLKASFDNLSDSQFFNLHIALLAMNVNSSVKAGENAGKFLKHDFVVIKQQRFLSSKNQWTEQLDNDFFNTSYPHTAFVAWIEELNNPAPIQAVGQIID
jgi:hypothetical protein